MIKVKDRIKSLIHWLVRSEAANGFTACKCKKRRKNWVNFSFKKNYLIGYDKILREWVAFAEYDSYAKIWAMNGYIINIYTLHEELWEKLKPLCRKCINTFLRGYKEPEDEKNETG